MENSQQLPDDFLELCRSVTAKRPKAVIDHILQHGFITTEELKEIYGYSHGFSRLSCLKAIGVVVAQNSVGVRLQGIGGNVVYK
ncbi:hypothetical protein VPK24_14630 [Limnothrix redekei LRLZ20PSL1]|uniref:Uncharacterized protein n=1 Tax=Limnothrix redekei LRLZ20PSL1 TaxID=3112953 RepID=A0ABW7CCK1_9CYAN